MKKYIRFNFWLLMVDFITVIAIAGGCTIQPGNPSNITTSVPSSTAVPPSTTPTPLIAAPTGTPLPPTDTPVPTATPTEVPTETPTATPATPLPVSYDCIDPIGCLKLEPQDPIHLAYLLIVNGPNASLGIDSRNGVELAIDDAAGSILGHPIQFDGEDGGCTAAGGASAAARLASDPTIIAVIGPSCSSETRGGEPLLSQAGLVTISPSNTAPDLTDPTSPSYNAGYFRTSYNDQVQGLAAAEFAFNVLGARSAATLNDGTLYAGELQNVFAGHFIQLGGSVTHQLTFRQGITSFSRVLGTIAQDSPDLLYFPVFMPDGQYIIEQAKDTPGLENTRLMGADGLYTPDLVYGAGSAVNGFMVSSAVLESPQYDEFLDKYVAKFDSYPMNIFHAHAYDAFNIIKAAIEKVAVVLADGSVYIPRQALRDAIATTENFPGVTGVLTCNSYGECANPVIGIYEFKGGQYPPDLIWKQGE